jgi:hypothetical protein
MNKDNIDDDILDDVDDKNHSTEITYSRTAFRETKRKKDKRLEALIEEINKNHQAIEEDEILDLPVRGRRGRPPKDKIEEELLINKPVESSEEELLLNPKRDEATIVLPKVKKNEIKEIIEVDEEESILTPTEEERFEEVISDEPKKEKKKKKKYRVRKAPIIIIILLILLISGGAIYISHKNKIDREKREEEQRIKNYIKDVESHYNKKVVVNTDASIYKKVGNNYQLYGTIYKDNIINLSDQKIDKDTEYFHNDELDVYIKYKDVDKTDKEVVKDSRYKRYLLFNENIVTKDEYTIYHSDDTKLYKLSEKGEYPIIIKETDRYYFEYQDELVYVLKSDVKEIVKHENTKAKNVSSVPVLNYHFIYDPKERTCNQSICLTASRLEEHIKYFKDNKILDLTMHEFQLYMDKKLNLPKSVLLTFDDGWLRQKGVEILDKNEFHGTYFLITSVYLPIESKYVEFHSHTHNMHTQGQCPTGQGGGIQCLSEKKIQEDLKKSRELLNNTTAFCYPFYEWNEYAIGQLKKAGFTLGFIGGQRAAKPSDNHYRVPRYIIYSWTTVSTLKTYFN